MAEFTINNNPIIEVKLTLPKNGVWLAANCIIDSVDELSINQKVQMKFLDTTFNGTVVDTGVFQGFLRATIVGGTGNMAKMIESKAYKGLPAGQVIRDIGALTGHSIADSSDKDILNFVLSRWDKLKAKASDLIESLLKVTGGTWRILPDGSLWVGKEVYTPLNPNDYLVINKTPSEAKWSIYNESTLVQPFTSLEDNNIFRVEYEIIHSELFCTIFFAETFGDSITALAEQSKEILYNKIYRCRVVQQKQDDTLDLLPDPIIEEIKNGISDVPILTPFPGMRMLVPVGSHCFVFFANGDPRYPRVCSWESSTVDTEVNSIKVEMITTSGSNAARKGDSVGVLKFIPNPPQLFYNGSLVSAVDPGTKITIQEGSSIVTIGT